MNPFELAAHLVDRHLYSQELVDELDAVETRQLHADDHAGGHWSHRHDDIYMRPSDGSPS